MSAPTEGGGPRRIQLRRTKGWRKPEYAITVARPSKWGNPFAVGATIDHDDPLFPYVVTPLDDPKLREGLRGLSSVCLLTQQHVVECHAFWLYAQPELMLSLHELAGHDLACWCRLDEPCHADVLLELANECRHPTEVKP